MSLAKHKTALGFFSLLALGLLLFGIIALGGGKLFKHDTQFVLYFGSSVSGLSVGAPVVFRGVPLGSVTHISLVANANKSNVTIPVNISIDAANLILATGHPLQDEEEKVAVIQDMVSKGMRGRLQLSSLITGQYRIELDFFPDTPASFKSGTPQYEIPTVATAIDTLQKTIDRIPIEKVVANIDSALTHLSQLIESGDVDRALKAFADTFTQASTLLAALQSSPALLNSTLGNAEAGSAALKADLPRALENLNRAMTDFASAARRVDATTAAAEKSLNTLSPVTQELLNTLRETKTTVRSLRSLTDELDKNPESLIRGRKGAY